MTVESLTPSIIEIYIIVMVVVFLILILFLLSVLRKMRKIKNFFEIQAGKRNGIVNHGDRSFPVLFSYFPVLTFPYGDAAVKVFFSTGGKIDLDMEGHFKQYGRFHPRTGGSGGNLPSTRVFVTLKSASKISFFISLFPGNMAGGKLKKIDISTQNITDSIYVAMDNEDFFKKILTPEIQQNLLDIKKWNEKLVEFNKIEDLISLRENTLILRISQIRYNVAELEQLINFALTLIDTIKKIDAIS